MDIFKIHGEIIDRYKSYITSFIDIFDDDIREVVEKELATGRLWPEPIVQFNPSYEKNIAVSELVSDGTLSAELNYVFKGYELFTHQVEALKLGSQPKSFIVTSGTGSGKSLTFLGSIFNHLFQDENRGTGITAVLVYPMNALINSQIEELKKFKENYEENSGKDFPISFNAYTGQTKSDERQKIKESPPDILLTNYMMLELLLTRNDERAIRQAIDKNLRFLVFDELHTYRGRQGSDVGMLIRRIRTRCKNQITSIGTSATMVSKGSAAQQKQTTALVAEKIFGEPFTEDQIIGETLQRSLQWEGELPKQSALKEALDQSVPDFSNVSELTAYPICIWMENKFALRVDSETGLLKRATPRPMSNIVEELSKDSGVDKESCGSHLKTLLAWVSKLNVESVEKGDRYTRLPFKLHQFFAQTGSVYATLDPAGQRHVTLQPGLHFAGADRSEKYLFPHVFSRASGMSFICVQQKPGDGRLIPREFSETIPAESGDRPGYIIPGGNEIWDPENDIESVPNSWTRTTREGQIDFKPVYRSRAPTQISYDENGNYGRTGDYPFEGWFMACHPKGLLFDPTGGVFFETNTSERTKLTSLGNEGRSTSTTITSFLVLDALNRNGFPVKDQKLLSFTDNRQDAALQAGHFNDFLRVINVRSAIAKADALFE
jgi:hypothetical protein